MTAMSAVGPSGPSTSDVGRLVVRCPDRPGIVHLLSGLLTDAGANISIAPSDDDTRADAGRMFAVRHRSYNCFPGPHRGLRQCR